MGHLLQEKDRLEMEALASRGGTPAVRRRAQALLLYDDGLLTKEVSSRLGLSPSQTRYWKQRYQEQGLAIFAEEDLRAVRSSEALALDDQGPGPAAIESPEGGREPVLEGAAPAAVEGELPPEGEAGSPAEQGQRHPVHRPPVEHRRDLALALFDGTQSIHQLRSRDRRLLEAAALIQHLEEDQEDGEQVRAGRIFILSNPLAELDPEENPIVESILAYQRGSVKHLLSAGPGEERPLEDRTALVLAALLRIATGLAASGSRQTRILSIDSRPEALTIRIEGAGKDARSAERKSRLWSALFGQVVHIQTDRATREGQVKDRLKSLLDRKTPGVEATDTLAEAGRKVLGFHFAEMVRHEEGTRSGVDIEDLHDMRVATRRMRAAFEVFAGGFRSRAIDPYLKGLRATGRALGRVRDLDVFMEKAQHYLETLPEEERGGLDPLLKAWRQEREKDREEMLAHLNGEDYVVFKRRFLTFLTTPGEGARKAAPPTPRLVREVLPVLVYTRLGTVRAFAPVLDSATIEQLHALRIEFKKLRYTLEFFREVLGGEARELIEEIKVLQDHLGDLNDADVACQILREFLDEWENRQLMVPIDERDDPEPIVAYLATRHAERHRLVVTFRDAWARFDRPEVRARFAAAVSVL